MAIGVIARVGIIAQNAIRKGGGSYLARDRINSDGSIVNQKVMCGAILEIPLMFGCLI